MSPPFLLFLWCTSAFTVLSLNAASHFTAYRSVSCRGTRANDTVYMRMDAVIRGVDVYKTEAEVDHCVLARGMMCQKKIILPPLSISLALHIALYIAHAYA